MDLEANRKALSFPKQELDEVAARRLEIRSMIMNLLKPGSSLVDIVREMRFNPNFKIEDQLDLGSIKGKKTKKTLYNLISKIDDQINYELARKN